MLRFTSILLLLVATLAVLATAAAVPVGAKQAGLTNGERFARGLGPAKPKRLHSGSRTLSAREGGVSPQPQVQVRLAARLASSGDSDPILGYVRATQSGYAVINTKEMALSFTTVFTGPSTDMRLAGAYSATSSVFINNGFQDNGGWYLGIAEGVNDDGKPAGQYLQSSIFGGTGIDGPATVFQTSSTGSRQQVLLFVASTTGESPIMGYQSASRAALSLPTGQEIRLFYERVL